MTDFITSLNPLLKACKFFACFPIKLENKKLNIFTHFYSFIFLMFWIYFVFYHLKHDNSAMDAASVLAPIAHKICLVCGFILLIFNTARLFFMSNVMLRILEEFEKLDRMVNL